MKNYIQIKMKNLAFIFLTAFVFSTATSSHAQGNYRIIAAEAGTTNIVEIDKVTGNISFLFGLAFTVGDSDDMAYNPADGFIYIAHADGSGSVGFYKLDLFSKTANLVKTISGTAGDGSDGSLQSIGFTPSGDVYGYHERSAFTTGTLYFIPWATGNAQSLGSSGTPSILGGDYDAARNVFWASDEWNAKVYQLSVTNSSILWTSTSTWYQGNGPGDVLDMDVAPDGEILIGASDNNVFRILNLNPSTGTWTTNLTVTAARDFRFATFPYPIVNLVKAVTVSFSNLSAGTNYQLQVSTDLNSWTNFGSSFTATNSFMTYSNYWNVSDWNQLFFRLH